MTRIADIQAAVCARYGLERADMRTPDKHYRVAHPRQLAMFLSRRIAKRPLTVIGREFCRDHSTVDHAMRAVIKRMRNDADYRRDAVSIAREVRGL